MIVCSNVSGFAFGLNERVGFAVRLVVNEREGKDFGEDRMCARYLAPDLHPC